jgi:molybdate transport system substrate-binding protein
MAHSGLSRDRFFPLLLIFALVVAACDRSEPVATQTLAVFAATSLTGAFAEIAAAYELENAGVAVTLNLASSQQLAQQLVQGAPADVFASASEGPMQLAEESGRIAAGSQQLFARNRLVVITPADETTVAALSDLARPGVRLVLADATVPAGHYTLQFLEKASASAALNAGYANEVLDNVVSYEQNVRAVLTKVALGEAEAGIVYESDATGAVVRRIPIPEALNVVAAYPIAPIGDSARPELAADFVRFVISPAGQAILERHGFLQATAPEP